jgi:RecA-family ATPase
MKHKITEDQSVEKSQLEIKKPFSNIGQYNKIVTAQEMISNKIEEIPMLWGYLLPKTGISLLSGHSDTGKSTLVRQLCSSIVTGEKEFLSYELHPEFGSVIYVSTEDDYSSLSARFKKENHSNTGTQGLENFKFIFDYSDDNVSALIDEELTKMPADCVVIDALGDVITTDPNNIVNVRKFYSGFKRLSDKHGCLILFVHHNRKSSIDNNQSKSDVSGSQAIEAKPRAVLMLNNIRGEANMKELRVVKANYIPESYKNYPIFIDVDENGTFRISSSKHMEVIKNRTDIAFKSSEDEILKIRELSNSGLTIREIEEKMRSENYQVSRSTIARKLKQINSL